MRSRRAQRRFDAVDLELFRNRLTSVTEEMGAVLEHTGFSPNIHSRRDFSCAIFDAAGDMVAHAAHIPVHLGSTPLSVRAAIEHAYGSAMPSPNDPRRRHAPPDGRWRPRFTSRRRAPYGYVVN
jgi:N-methylhydantoinase B